jgi:hypothetical protein
MTLKEYGAKRYEIMVDCLNECKDSDTTYSEWNDMVKDKSKGLWEQIDERDRYILENWSPLSTKTLKQLNNDANEKLR